jgi:hypothetical protein
MLNMMTGWFTLGFVTGAIVCYGPILAKSILLNRQSRKAFEKATQMTKGVTLVQEDLLRLQEQYLELGKDKLALQDRVIALHEEHIETLQNYKAALEKLRSLGQL